MQNLPQLSVFFLFLPKKRLIYPDNFENKIGFDKIREQLKVACLSNLGREKSASFSFLTNYKSVDYNLKLAGEIKNIINFEGNFPSDNYYDVTSYLEKIRVERTFLEVHELVEIKKSLETIKAVLAFIKNKNPEKYLALKTLAKEVQVYPYVIDQINLVVNKHGKIKDNASKELAGIRALVTQKQSSISKTMQFLLKKYQGSGIVEQDAGVSIREGRMVLPVNASKKRAVQGYIHDESATGKTAFVEPSEIVELNNAIRELEFRERREILRILTDLSDAIRPYIDDLLKAYDFLAEIDFARAKALYAIKINAVKPILFDEQHINWRDARHPLLQETLEQSGKKVVPLSLEMNKDQKMLLISGPNAGGKSVCLKTMGLLQYMIQCGLLVPVKENSEFGIFNDIFIHLGDEQSIEDDLSTYSSHLNNMKFFLKNSGPQSLLLIDEFGTGTEPMIGGAIAEAILQKLNELNTYGVITTHYTNLKHYATSAEGIINAAMLFDHQKMAPTYQLEIGKPGSSFAFEIARKIGLPEDILEKATEKAGKDHIHFDKHLKDLQRDKKYWENKRQRIRKSEKKLEDIIEQYEQELEKTKKTRKEIVNNAKIQADDILSGANKVIENTIRDIKESNAEKEKTKNARQNVERFREKVKDENSYRDEKVEKNVKQLKNIRKELKKRQPNLYPKSKVDVQVNKEEIRIGNKVRIKGQDAVGEVMDINEKSVMVGFGSMFTTIEMGKLEKLSDGAGNQHSTHSIANRYDISKRSMNFKPDIDIRGKRAEEAINIITQFVDEAIMLNINEVRILHGKGNGILRQVIRQHLGNFDEIASFADEHVERGGAGITVVRF